MNRMQFAGVQCGIAMVLYRVLSNSFHIPKRQTFWRSVALSGMGECDTVAEVELGGVCRPEPHRNLILNMYARLWFKNVRSYHVNTAEIHRRRVVYPIVFRTWRQLRRETPRNRTKLNFFPPILIITDLIQTRAQTRKSQTDFSLGAVHA